MNITANTTNYRITLTDPATGKKKKLTFPISGTLKQKREKVREIQLYVEQCKVKSKKLEAKALIFEAEACRKEKHNFDMNMIISVEGIRQKERSNPIDKLFDRYKLTEKYTGISDKSKYVRELHFTKFVEFLTAKNIVDAEQLKHDHAVEFMLKLDGKNSTFNKYLTNLSGVFTAIKLDNPFKGISRKNEEEDVEPKEPFTDEEINTIFTNLTGDWLEICKISRYTGLRFEDCIHLNKSNIVLDFKKQSQIIKIMPDKTNHTGRFIYIQILPPIEFILNKAADPKGFFFPDKVKKYKKGTKYAGVGLNRTFVSIMKRLEINKTFHGFRHSFANDLRKIGYTDEQIATVLGHSTAKQSRDYGDFHNPLDLTKIM